MARSHRHTDPDSPTRQLARSLVQEALYGRDVMLYSHVTLCQSGSTQHAVWRPEAISAALRLWHRVYGRPPTTHEWRKAKIYGLPYATTVRQHWRTVQEAWEAALRSEHTRTATVPRPTQEP